MDKVRIHELAKALNTNSKRIIEKLNEIDIHPKGPMSFLEPDEYNKLRQHLGMPPIESTVKQDAVEENNETDAAKASPLNRKAVNKPKAGGFGQSNNIIKRRIINVEEEKPYGQQPKEAKTQTKRASAGSGLLAGYVVKDDSEITSVKGKRSTNTAKKKPSAKKFEHAEKPEDKKSNEQDINSIEKIQKSDRDIDIYSEKVTVAEVKDEPIKEPAEKAVQEELDKEEVIKNSNELEHENKSTAEIIEKEIKDEEIEKAEIVKSEDVKPKEEVKEEIVIKEETKEEVKVPVKEETVKRENSFKPADKDFNNRNNTGYQQRNYSTDKGYQRSEKQGERQGSYRQGEPRQGDRQGAYRQGEPRQGERQGAYRQGEPRQGGYRQQGDRQGGYRQGESRQQGSFRQGDRQGTQRPGQERSGGYQQGGYQQKRNAGYVPGKDDEDDKPAYLRKQAIKKDDKKEDSSIHKTDKNARIEEAKKEAQAREQEKSLKRESKKESAPKSGLAFAKSNKRSNKLDMPFVGEKKGVNEVFSDDFVLDGISQEDANKFKRNKNRRGRKEPIKTMQPPVIAVLTNVTLPESLTVKELSESLKKTSAEVMKKMLLMGIMANVNQVIDFATAEIVADEFGIKATQEIVVTEEDVLFDDVEDENDEGSVSRPPVVVVMGHVDHGKTSLLDAIRSSQVVVGEAGGITQHIGAYTVNIKDRDITFLDTPGHEAFTAMRARGAQTTDIAILVVAADDGVMPQTVESINHAKAANVSVIVAVNKIDKPGANVERVMQELTEHNIVAEEWGGDTIFVPVSAKKNENIDTLLEMVLLTADVMDLKANPNKQPKGTIIEAKLDKNRGPVATMLVQRGTLRLGDSVVTGTTVGRIRAMADDKGMPIKEAGPSIPVEILGLPDVPQAGEVFYGITDERMAKQLAEKRKSKIREEQSKSKTMVSLDDLFNQIQEGNIKEINIIVKADVQGSVEAVKQSLEKLSNEDVRVRIIHGAVGAINESDISLAQVSNAMIIGFNVRPGANVQTAAESAGVDMRLYTIIYNAIEDVSAAMKGMLDPTYREVVQGHAEIRQIYKVSGVGTIAGCYVTDGKLTRNSEVRVIRDGIVIYTGKLASLKRFKDDVKEVLTNFECGLSVEKYNDIRELDVIESYIIEEVKRD